ncbi:putative DNA primase large subunit [Paratrimastix pyriformis]|uniref:DNA primase large subunit n=1 Tax=Paratrimastix pyriformis TaxID=342808 RepID=A0ABQ8UAU7_9EUKA|nr:putative DNA primase large subunit [Paratrimastix pyriformis]
MQLHQVTLEENRPKLLIAPRAQIILSFYVTPPQVQFIELESFFSLAHSRIQFLRTIEGWRAQKFTPSEMDVRIAKLEAEEQYAPLRDPENDLISHYILTLAYAQRQELRNFVLGNELALFGSRLRRASEREKIRFGEFLDASGLQFQHPDDVEFALISTALKRMEEIRMLNQGRKAAEAPPVIRSRYYKVPWQQCPEMVSRRNCFLWRGSLYLIQEELPALLVPIFRTLLSRRLACNQRALPSLELADDRLARLLGSLANAHLGNDYRSAALIQGVTARNIDLHCRDSFPPCMRRMFSKLRETHHLKHTGRMQLGLFLKGAGLSLEDSMQVWREELTRVVGDKFDKEYAYNIRHNYGLEGKRVNYSPYSCAKLIPTLPGTGEYHGCPFRYMERDELLEFLKSAQCGLSDAQAHNVLEPLFRKGEPKHYHVACRAFWHALHGADPTTDEPIVHPNQFFELSYRARHDKTGPQQQQQQQQTGGATATATTSGDPAARKD